MVRRGREGQGGRAMAIGDDDGRGVERPGDMRQHLRRADGTPWRGARLEEVAPLASTQSVSAPAPGEDVDPRLRGAGAG